MTNNFIIFNRIYSLELSQAQSKTEQKGRVFPILPAFTHAKPLHYQHSPPERYLCYNCGTYTNTSLTLSSQFKSNFTLGIVYSISLEKCKTTCIYHYNIVQSSFTALEIFYSQPNCLSLSSNPQQPLILLFLQFCLFQKIYITQYLAIIFIYLFIYLLLFRATPAACGSSQAGVELELQLLACDTATAIQDLSHVCEQHHSSHQHWIPYHRVRPGIKASSSKRSVRFLSTAPKRELQQ